MKIKSKFKGIDAFKHKLNLTRVKLALLEKSLSAYEGVKRTYNKCLIEVNKSKIKILKLENKIMESVMFKLK